MTQKPQAPLSVPKVTSIRRRALDAAREMLEQSGPDALQLRALADQIECGVASLYYHFENKEQLLASIAVEGFHELERELQKVQKGDEKGKRVEAASFAYLRFMHKHLRLYALMHSADLLANNESVREAEKSTFASYRASLVGDPRIPDKQVEDLSLMFWALGRGIASIILTQGDITRDEAVKTAESILRGYLFVQLNTPKEPL